LVLYCVSGICTAGAEAACAGADAAGAEAAAAPPVCAHAPAETARATITSSLHTAEFLMFIEACPSA
jgi:hypothetical protein